MSNELKGDVILLVTTLLASVGWFFSKEVLSTMAPLQFVSTRFTIAGLILLVFFWHAFSRVNRSDVWPILRSSLCFALFVNLWIYGMMHITNLAIGAFIINISFLLVPVLAIFFGERASMLTWFSLPIALIGMAFLFLDNEFHFGYGEVIFLLAALVFALFFISNAGLSKRYSSSVLVTSQMLTTGLSTLILSTMLATWSFQHSSSVWICLLLTIVVTSCLRFSLQTWGQSFASAGHASVIMTLEPVWVAIISLLVFSKGMTSMQTIGCALMFFAVLLSRSEPLINKVKSKRVNALNS